MTTNISMKQVHNRAKKVIENVFFEITCQIFVKMNRKKKKRFTVRDDLFFLLNEFPVLAGL